MGWEVNRNELAEVFGVTPPTVTAWVERGCPYLAGGRKGRVWLFDTAAVARWREEQARQEAQEPTAAVPLEEAQRRREVALAELAELDLADRRAAREGPS
jgi:phage terminase Nu1 subunit (DNA packaging protein)